MGYLEFISRAEEKYVKNLEEFFVRIWKDTYLPSHDLDHHRRVWRFAKELLLALNEGENSDLPSSPEKILIACYLHDTGLSIDLSASHGKKSREICVKFLADNNLAEKKFKDVLDAIEFHDMKEQDFPLSPVDIIRIVSTADDLDAFGYIGIYRYFEIYLLRGIPRSELGPRIRENAATRFRNFLNAFGSCRKLVARHSIRFRILDDFFRDYGTIIPDTGEETTTTGRNYQPLFSLFEKMIINKAALCDIESFRADYDEDPLTAWYLTGMESELRNYLSPAILSSI